MYYNIDNTIKVISVVQSIKHVNNNVFSDSKEGYQ